MMKNQSPTSEEARDAEAKVEVSSNLTSVSGRSKGPADTAETTGTSSSSIARQHRVPRIDHSNPSAGHDGEGSSFARKREDKESSDKESSDEESKVRLVRDFMVALLNTNDPDVNVLKMNPAEVRKKMERKRLSNRESAKRKRQRDKREVENLNKLCSELRDQNTQLQNRVAEQEALMQSERQAFARQKARLEGQVAAALQLAAAASQSPHLAPPPPQFHPPQGGILPQLGSTGNDLLLQHRYLQQQQQPQLMGQQLPVGVALDPQQQQQQGNDERIYSLALQSLTGLREGVGAAVGAAAAHPPSYEDLRRRLLMNGPEIQRITANNEDLRRRLLSALSSSSSKNQGQPRR